MQIFAGKNIYPTIVNGLSVLKLFQHSNGDLFYFVACPSIYKVREPRILGHTTFTTPAITNANLSESCVFEPAEDVLGLLCVPGRVTDEEDR